MESAEFFAEVSRLCAEGMKHSRAVHEDLRCHVTCQECMRLAKALVQLIATERGLTVEEFSKHLLRDPEASKEMPLSVRKIVLALAHQGTSDVWEQSQRVH